MSIPAHRSVVCDSADAVRDEPSRTLHDLGPDRPLRADDTHLQTNPNSNESESAETLLGCNVRRLAKGHHAIDHPIHRRLSFFEGFRRPDRSQVRQHRIRRHQDGGAKHVQLAGGPGSADLLGRFALQRLRARCDAVSGLSSGSSSHFVSTSTHL
jgi:hypothetical protein